LYQLIVSHMAARGSPVLQEADDHVEPADRENVLEREVAGRRSP
jgi:hypothetical protein